MKDAYRELESLLAAWRTKADQIPDGSAERELVELAITDIQNAVGNLDMAKDTLMVAARMEARSNA